MKTKTSQNEPAKARCAPADGAAAGWKRCAHEMPDSDLTVMIHHADEDEPVWMGYHDGATWRQVDGTRCAVTHWMHLPDAPSGCDGWIGKLETARDSAARHAARAIRAGDAVAEKIAKRCWDAYCEAIDAERGRGSLH